MIPRLLPVITNVLSANDQAIVIRSPGFIVHETP